MNEPVAPVRLQPPPELPEIAKWVLVISGVVILAIASISLWGAREAGAEEFARTSQLVFNSLLPLLGTWVGTVLAYYFSKSNFETASSSVERMVTLTTEQKLGRLTVEQEMLRVPQITLHRIPPGKTPADVPLKDLLAKMGGKVTRLPITDGRGVVLYILHQSGLYRFLTEQAMGGRSPQEIQTLTLQDLVDDAELKNWVTNISYIAERATVADAKTTMERRAGCQDLIVTATGSKDEPMIGWMTNVDIGRLSKA